MLDYNSIMPVTGPPLAFIVEKPHPNTVSFGGRFVNVMALATAQGISHSHASRVMAGTKVPSVDVVTRLAGALGMTMDDFIQAIHDRKTEADRVGVEAQHKHRKLIRNERLRKKNATEKGDVFVPNPIIGRV